MIPCTSPGDQQTQKANNVRLFGKGLKKLLGKRKRGYSQEKASFSLAVSIVFPVRFAHRKAASPPAQERLPAV